MANPSPISNRKFETYCGCLTLLFVALMFSHPLWFVLGLVVFVVLLILANTPSGEKSLEELRAENPGTPLLPEGDTLDPEVETESV